ncbi:MAG TPA: metal-dependent hydrolase [Candidatus Competibacteraceae bacterium]|nr:metal-dependent hydrolase [Candidatus Competibacteraceae bacterium]
MADFRTHLLGAAAVSGAAATGLLLAGAAGREAVVGYFSLGVIGGLLPDIDSETSIPVRVAFTVLALLAAFLMVFVFAARYSLIELFILGVASFAVVRYGVFSLFSRFTVHRGLIHSIPAGLAFALGTTLLAHRFFAAAPLAAWLCGAFILLGFLVHLTLDELYSVNLMGMRVKSSFGTALCLGSLDNPLGTAALYLLVVLLWLASPSLQPLLGLLLDDATYRVLLERLVPRSGQGWFRGLLTTLADLARVRLGI